MKVSVNSSSNAKDIPADATELHLVRPAKHRTIEEILKKCGNLEKITMSASCSARLPEKTKKMLREKGIQTGIEKKSGRAIEIGLEKMLHVIELRKDFQGFREIEQVTGIPKSTVHYLVKYAQRAKVKKGKNIVYLK